MKKYRFLLIFILTIAIFSCKERERSDSRMGYTIRGIAKDLPDSTKIFLTANNQPIDSTFVLNEKFYFEGMAIDQPLYSYLVRENSNDAKAFWLENADITFEGKKDSFREGRIEGSGTQEMEEAFREKMLPPKKTADSLLNLIRKVTPSDPVEDSLMGKYLGLKEVEDSLTKQFVKEFPESYVSARILNTMKTTWGKETTEGMFAVMPENIKQSEYGKSIARFLELSKNLQMGDKFIDFVQPTPDGEQMRLSDLRGKYTLIEFWASWCAPCRKSNPDLVKLYEEFKDQGFEIVGVSLDQKKNSWIKAIEKDGLTWTNLSDLKGQENEAGLIYGVKALPDNFLIDEKGVIIARGLYNNKLRVRLEEIFENKILNVPQKSEAPKLLPQKQG